MPRKKRAYNESSSVSAGAARLVGDLRAYHSQLVQQRAALDTEVDAITEALSAMGGAPAAGGGVRRGPGRPPGKRGPGRPPGKRGPGRPPGKSSTARKGTSKAHRPGSLKDCIMKVLGQSSGSVAVKDISKRLKNAGYKTKSKSLGNQVTMALREMPGVSKVGRGQYAAR